MRSLLIALTVAVAFCGGAAVAQPSEPKQNAAGFVSDMAMGRLLFAKGRLADAEVFLLQAAPTSDADILDRALLLAVIAKEKGDTDTAIHAFETILTARPGNTEARLHLADLYVRTGKRDKADFHLSVALRDQALDPQIGSRVGAFLDDLRASERFAFSVSAAILPQTNASRRPAEAVVVSAGGVPLSFPTAESGVGFSLGGGGVFAPTLNETTRGRLALSGSAQVYKNSDLNEMTVGAEAGIERLLPSGAVLGAMRAERTWLGGKGFRKAFGPLVSWRHALTPTTEMTWRLSGERRLHDVIKSRDGHAIEAKVALRKSFGVKLLLDLDAALERIEAHAGNQSATRLRFGAGLAYAFDGGLTLAGGLSLSLDHRDDALAIFGERRRDRLMSGSVRALHRAVRYKGFAPFVEYAYERNASTIDLYAYDNHRFGLGVTRRF